MNRSETIATLAASLCAAQAEMAGASKDKTNPHFKSKYADLGSAWEACRGPLTKNGLSVIQLPSSQDGCVRIETILLHKSGEFISDTLALPVTKQDAQGYGSAMTYARRYSLMAVVGIAPEDDDANDSISGATPASANAPANPRKSSAGAKRDGDYEAIKAEIKGCTNPDELKEWGKANRERINALPKAFEDPIRDAYQNHMEDLTIKLGAAA